jgi:hypothetical protein
MSDPKKPPIHQDDDVLADYLKRHLEPDSFHGDFLMPWLMLRIIKNLERLVAATEKRGGLQREGDQQ